MSIQPEKPTSEKLSKIKIVSEALPVGTTYALVLSFLSLSTFYAYYYVEPFYFYDLGDISKLLLNNVTTILTLIIFLFIQMILPTILLLNYIIKLVKSEYSSAKRKAAVVYLTLYFIWVPSTLILYILYSGKFIYVNVNYSTELVVLRIIGYISIIANMIFYVASNSSLTQTRFTYRIKHFIVAVFVLGAAYIPLESYLNAKALSDCKYNRNIAIISANDVILPFDENRFIIGSTSKMYLFYNNKKNMVETIDEKNILKVLVFKKINNYYVTSKY